MSMPGQPWSAAPGGAATSVWPGVVVATGPVPGLVWAGLGRRFGAVLIDAAVLIGVLLVLVVGAMATGLAYDSEGYGRREIAYGAELVWFIVILVYLSSCWLLFQGTIGQRALGMRVVRMADGRRLGAGAAIARSVLWLLSVLSCTIGIVAAVVAANVRTRRSLIDLAVGSAVVTKEQP
jgi:uncharacterized RDD family membrane protein YckC